MKRQLELWRAIGSEFITRKLRGATLVAGIVSIALLGITLWLATISAWWWLLAVPVTVLILLFVLTYILASVVVRTLRPQITHQQTAGVSDFVDKLERVAESIQTPVFIIVLQVIRDVIRPRSETFLFKVTKDSATLHRDYLELSKLF